MLWQRRTALGLLPASALWVGALTVLATAGCAVESEPSSVAAASDAVVDAAAGVLDAGGNPRDHDNIPRTPLGPWQHCALIVPGDAMSLGPVPMGEIRSATACIVGCAGVEVIDTITVDGDAGFWVSGGPLWVHGFPNGVVPVWGRPLVLREGDAACVDVRFHAQPSLDKAEVGALKTATLRVGRRFGPPLELSLRALATAPVEAEPPVDSAPPPLLRVVLRWQRPGDPAATPGQDLDLHLVHPLAKGGDHDCDGKPDGIFDDVLDCSFRNPKPKWEAEGGANPRLVQGDLATPEESIVLDALPSGSFAGSLDRYRLFVHHFHDHAEGPVTALIDVYLHGALVATTEHPLLEPGAVWNVGLLNLPNLYTTPATAIPPLSSCWQHGATCAGGKFWQSIGSPCTRTCYPLPSSIAQLLAKMNLDLQCP